MYSDIPMKARFMEDENGQRLIFGSYDEADDYLMSNAENGVYYKAYGDDD